MNKTKNKIILFYIVSCMFVSAVQAAAPLGPAAIREQFKKTQDYYEFQKSIEKIEDKGKDKEGVVDETAPKKTDVPQTTKKIHVNKIVTDKSDILTQQEIRGIVEPYEGRDITITELFAAIEKINQLYKDKYYLSAKAVLPPQKVEDGLIKIKLIESRIGDLIVENNKNTREEYVTDRIGVNQGSLVNLNILESELFYFNSINDVKIRAVLKPGKEFATTDYFLQVEEPLHHYTKFYADNTGSDDTGNERIGVNFVNNSLLGDRDVFSVGADVTAGVKSAFVSYNIPISRRGTRLGVSADYSKVKVIEGAFESLNIEGSSYNIGGFVTHPFLVEKNYLLNAFVGLNKKDSYTEFDNIKVFETDVATTSFGVDFQYYGEKGPLYSRHVVTVSYDGLFGADRDFAKYNGEMSKIFALDKNIVVLLRGSAQLSDTDLLPSSEQFQLGGISTVRGYPSGHLVGDDGYFTSAEVSFPLFDAWGAGGDPYSEKLRGKVFIDHGGAFPYKGNNTGVDSSDFISSVGIGVNMNFTKAWSAQLVVAAPVSDKTDSEDSFMLHFYMSYLIF